MIINNTQEPWPLVRELFLQVHSIFPTIQGEGPFAGRRAVFVRLAGCNLQCPGCDTTYVEGAIGPMYPDAIVAEVDKHGYGLVVITGGEPFRQDLARLVQLLYDSQHLVQIETNGTIAPPGVFPWPRCTIVVSPKTGRVHYEIAKHAAAYKYVLNSHEIGEDGLPLYALGHPAHPRLARPPSNVAVYLQPQDMGDWELNEINTAATVESCRKHGYILSLQLHKILGLP